MRAVWKVVKTSKAITKHTRVSVSTTTALLVLGFWCGSAAGSSGVAIPHDKSVTTQVSQPAITETQTESLVEDIEVIGISDDADDRFSEFPKVSVRLPGVSATVLPRFRRQMFRTDI